MHRPKHHKPKASSPADRARSLPAKSYTDPSADRRYIVFDPDVSPGLKPHLTEIQNKIILPSYINAAQRDRITNPDLRHALKTNPVIIEIDDLQHRFDFLSIDDLPRTTKLLVASINEMQTPRDFDNLGRLLTGLRRAKRTIKPHVLARITRMLGTKGHVFSAIEAARQVKKTGFQVSTPRIAHDLLFWTQYKAMASGWARRETEQAAKWARVVAEMAGSPIHKARPRGFVDCGPLERDPLVVAAQLHMVSAFAVGHQGGVDVGNRAGLLARQLVDVWPRGKKLAELYTDAQRGAHERFGGAAHVTVHKVMLTQLAMALHGFRLATQILEPRLADHVAAVADAVQVELDEHRAGFGEVHEGSVADKVLTGLFDGSGNIKFEVQPEPEPVAEVQAEAAEAAAAVEEK